MDHGPPSTSRHVQGSLGRTPMLALLALAVLFGGCSNDQQLCGDKSLRCWHRAPTFAKASLALTGKRPSPQQTASVSAGNYTALTSEIDALLETEAFYSWVEDVYADVLRTRSYLSHYDGKMNTLLADFNVDAYPLGDLVRYGQLKNNCSPSNPTPCQNGDGLQYIAALAGLTDPSFLKEVMDKSGDYLAEEPLKLISYVVRNNLPFSDILSADYAVLNPHTAFVYGVDVKAEFGDDYTDATYWKPVHVKAHLESHYEPHPVTGSYWWPVTDGELQHAGILSTTALLARYPTDTQNKHRRRAHFVLKHFLNFDVLEDLNIEQIVTPELLNMESAVMHAPCASCHDYIDPMAQSFRNFGHTTYVKPRMVDPSTNQPLFQTDNTMADPLASGDGTSDPGIWFSSWQAAIPVAKNASRLRWLGEQVEAVRGEHAGQRTEFAYAVTTTVFNALMGANARAEIDQGGDSGVKLKAFLNETALSFRAANYNFKALVRALLLSNYFRGARAVKKATASDQDRLAAHGSAKLLTPEALATKIRANFSDILSASGLQKVIGDIEAPHKLGLAYGGTDYAALNARNSEMNPFMANIQLKVASELACQVVKAEFSKPQAERGIFTTVELDTEFIPGPDGNLVVMGIPIAYAYDRVGVPRALTELATLMTLWGETSEAGEGAYDIPFDCRPTALTTANGETISRRNTFKWMAVLTYVFADYYVFHQ